jgi:hypothetical protein
MITFVNVEMSALGDVIKIQNSVNFYMEFFAKEKGFVFCFFQSL